MELEELPTANWPETDGIYKVVQLYIEGKPYLRIATGSTDTPFSEAHRDVLKGVAILLGRECPIGNWERPALESEWYRATGMGMANIKIGKRKAYFSERSVEYDIGIDKKHLDSMRELLPEWELVIQNWLDAF